MECSAKRLIPSAQVVQLLLIDPYLITVTCQSVTAQGKTIFIDGDILAAKVCGRDRFVLYGTDGYLRLFGLELIEICRKRVGPPPESGQILMSANTAGDRIAVRNGADLVSLYAIDTDIVYIGSTQLAENASSLQVVKGTPGSPGILIVFAGVLATLVEISKSCPVISTVRISHNPVMDVLPLAREGDYLVLTCNKVRIFALRDILVGKFEVPSQKLPGTLTCASSTRLKDGSITNTAICGGKLYQIDPSGSTLMLCRHPVLSSVCFFCLVPGPVTLVHWTSRNDSGRFILDEDNDSLNIDSDIKVNYAAQSFVFEGALLGYGSSGITALSQSLKLSQLAEVQTEPVCNIFYDEYLYIVYSTCTSIVSIAVQADGVEFHEEQTINEQALTVGMFDKKRILVCPETIKLGNESINIEGTHSAIIVGHLIVMAVAQKLVLFSMKTLKTTTLVDARYPITFVANAGGLYYGTTEPALYSFTLEGVTNRVDLIHDGIPESVAYNDGLIVSYRDGMVEMNSSLTCLGEGPIYLRSFESRVLAYGKGLWLVESDKISRLLSTETFDAGLVGGVSLIPYFDLSVIVAYNEKLYFLSRPEPQPLVLRISDKSTIKMCSAATFRCWVAATSKGLAFFDSKHLKLLNCSSDLSGELTALDSWNIQLNGENYNHLLLGSERNMQYTLRSVSVKRERNSIFVRKRLKLVVNSKVNLIHAIDGGALVARGKQLELLRVGDQGLSLREVKTFEGTITDISYYKGVIYLSTTHGLAKLNFEEVLYDPDHMVNRMRSCVCHCCVEYAGKDYVVSAEENCFINIYEIGSNKRWKLVQRLQSAKRVIYMQKANIANIPSGTVVIIALTSTGSYIEVKLGASRLHLGPYF